MKKSEALKAIKDSLYCHLPQYKECPDYIAETVLQSLEGLGMLPPIRNADLKSMYGYARIYEWEKE